MLRFKKKKGFFCGASYLSRWRRLNEPSVFISSMAMIFIFGFAKKYLQEKKLGHFENRRTNIFREHVFDFPHKTFTKNHFFPLSIAFSPWSCPASDPGSAVGAHLAPGTRKKWRERTLVGASRLIAEVTRARPSDV